MLKWGKPPWGDPLATAETPWPSSGAPPMNAGHLQEEANEALG